MFSRMRYPSRPVPFLLLAGALASACAPASAPARDPGPWPAAPAALADSLLRDVRAADPTILVEARYAGSDNFTGQPLPGYGANRLLLRREAATALARVHAQLRPAGLGLKVFDGYRPIRATLAMVEWTERAGRTDLLDDGYIARRSRHNLGLAVDLTLVELATGRELPMGTSFDEFTPAAHTANASGEVAANRRRLVEAMEAAGFENYEQEWWHFSYAVPGDPPAFDVPVGGKR
jgi:zinc D-Ala-D-Ala dipeptidase